MTLVVLSRGDKLLNFIGKRTLKFNNRNRAPDLGFFVWGIGGGLG